MLDQQRTTGEDDGSHALLRDFFPLTGGGHMASDSPSLGSLSQAARLKQLNVARGILLFVGIVTVIANAVFFAMIERHVDEAFNKEIQELRSRGMEVDPAEVAKLRESAIATAKLIQGAGVALGIVFIVLGVLVKTYPVPMTVTSLILYVGAGLVFGMIDPTTLYKGLIIKILIIVGLVKSVQAAIAYQREDQSQRQRDGLAPLG
jgi:hypothetical protein